MQPPKILRRPHPGTALGVVAVVLAISPLADAGTHSGRVTARAAAGGGHARFADRANNANNARQADNASRVNGFRASAQPGAHTLLPLDDTGHFPASVFPQGVQGPQGPQGPPGSAGVERFVFTCSSDGCKTPTTGDATKPAVAFAACKANERVVGGGYEDVTGTHTGFDETEQSSPVQQYDANGNPTTNGWYVQMTNVPPPGGTATFVEVKAWAVCRS